MRISAYETSDGKVFKEKPEAEKHEAWLILLELVQATLPLQASSESSEDIAEQRATWLLDNFEVIRKSHNKLRPKKPKNGEAEVAAEADK